MNRIERDYRQMMTRLGIAVLDRVSGGKHSRLKLRAPDGRERDYVITNAARLPNSTSKIKAAERELRGWLKGERKQA